jgi:serine/threonine protein kinase
MCATDKMRQRRDAILHYEGRIGHVLLRERRAFNADARALRAGGLTLSIDTQCVSDLVDFDHRTLRQLEPLPFPRKKLPTWPHAPIGQGCSSAVYSVTRAFAEKIFPKMAWRTPKHARPALLAVKEITVNGELKQLFGHARELRTERNIRQHLQYWAQRCAAIYTPLSLYGAEWGLAPYVVTPHACAFLQSRDGRAAVPSLVLATDLVQGSTLHDMLTSASPRDALCVLLQGLSVLSLLWQHGMYHNDFHTHNVLVVEDRVDSCIVHFPTQSLQLRGNVPMIRVIDFDLATTGAPRDGNYAPTTAVGVLPFLDAAFFYSTVRAVTGALPVEDAFCALVEDAIQPVGRWRHSDIVPRPSDDRAWAHVVASLVAALGSSVSAV